MLYFLQVIIYTLAMLLIYFLFLRNRPLYSISRSYLLLTAILPLVLPFIKLPAQYRPQLHNVPIMHINLPAIVESGSNENLAAHGNIPWLWLVYTIVALIFVALYLWQGFRLWQLIRKNPKQDQRNYTLIITPGYGPGSFGRYIFFPGNDINPTILAHEQAHIQLRHTRGLILLTILQALMWPNLLLIWIRKELKEVHEFQADQQVNPDKEAYTRLLLSSVFSTTTLPLIHPFFNHPMKRRIMMLRIIPLPYLNRVVSILKTGVTTLLFFTGIVYLQSCNQQETKLSQSKVPDIKFGRIDSLTEYIPPKVESNPAVISGLYDTYYDTVISDGKRLVIEHKVYNSLSSFDRKPESKTDVNKFLVDNLKYPENAKQKGIQGRVVVKLIINEMGQIWGADIVTSPDTSLSVEALRVVNMMPDWNPGTIKGRPVAAYYYLPILFKL